MIMMTLARLSARSPQLALIVALALALAGFSAPSSSKDHPDEANVDMPGPASALTLAGDAAGGYSEPAQTTAPTWLVLLYLAGDNELWIVDARQLLTQLGQAPYNPSMRLVVLYDGDRPGGGDSYIYTREREGLIDVTEAALGSQTWVAFVDGSAGQREFDTGEMKTLLSFISWSRNTYFTSQYTMLAIADHGGGWAPDIVDMRNGSVPSPQSRTVSIVEAGGWRGMSLDYTPVGVPPGDITSLSTKELGLAIRNQGVDVLFLDACLMGMVEVAYEVQPYASYMVAGENLMFAQSSYNSFFDPSVLTANTSPNALARTIVDRANRPDTAEQPYTIAALNLSALPNLVSKIDSLAAKLLAALNTDITAKSKIQAAYAAAQKFDYDSSLTIDQGTDGYVDLSDFARQLATRHISPTIDSEALGVAQAVGVAGGPNDVVMATHAVSGTFLFAPQPQEPWNFTGAYGLSIYLPIGEEDCRPTGEPGIPSAGAKACKPGEQVLDPTTNLATERQLYYYTDPDTARRLAFVDAAPSWPSLIERLQVGIPQRHLDERPFRSPTPLHIYKVYLPIIVR